MLQRVSERPILGLTEEICGLLAACDDPRLYWPLEQALSATVRGGDEAVLARSQRDDPKVSTAAAHEREIQAPRIVLERALKSARPAARAAAIAALARMGTEKATTALLAHRAEADPLARVCLGEALVKLGRREGLPLLIDLLTTEDGRSRTRAAIALQSSTGQSHGFFAAKDERQRAAAAERWRDWLRTHATAPLRTLDAGILAFEPFP